MSIRLPRINLGVSKKTEEKENEHSPVSKYDNVWRLGDIDRGLWKEIHDIEWYCGLERKAIRTDLNKIEHQLVESAYNGKSAEQSQPLIEKRDELNARLDKLESAPRQMFDLMKNVEQATATLRRAFSDLSYCKKPEDMQALTNIVVEARKERNNKIEKLLAKMDEVRGYLAHKTMFSSISAHVKENLERLIED